MILKYITKCISIGSKSYEGRVMMVAVDHSSQRGRNMKKKTRKGDYSKFCPTFMILNCVRFKAGVKNKRLSAKCVMG